MQKQKNHREVWRLLVGVLCMLLMMPAGSMAAGPVDTNKNVGLTIDYKHEGTPIPQAEFRLYHVAKMDAHGVFHPDAAFTKYPLTLQGLDQRGWQDLAGTLAGYVQRDGLPALDQGRTDEKGRLTFPVKGAFSMKPGLYLVIASRCEAGGYAYTASPFVVALPSLDSKKNAWEYTLAVTPKHTREKGEDKVSRKVLKIWRDGGEESARPKEVTIDLLKDGKVAETVKLNAQNQWRHTWNDLDGKHEWTVVERAVTGYTVLVQKEGTTFTVTNTKTKITVKPPEPPPDKPRENSPDKPPQKLPQTGVLWWPAQVMAAAGLLLLARGWIRRKGDHHGC